MTTLLQLNTSLFSSNGQSTRLANQFVDAWRAANPTGRVTVRDLAQNPVPHLDAERFLAFLAQPEARTAQQQAIVAYSDGLIEEIRGARVIVLGLPMYNFSIPSTLKAYFDHIARAGITFRYTEKGAEGLLADKRVYVFATRDGRYAGTLLDFQTPYVRQFLGFLGVTDVEFVYAEGLAMGAPSRQAAVSDAEKRIKELARSPA